MSYSFLSEKKEVQAAILPKKRGAKSVTTEESLDNITAKLSTLGISKTNPHKTSQQITLSDGTKIIDGSKEVQQIRNCNWCKHEISGDTMWGIPLWILPQGKKFAVEGVHCSPNCCAAFLNYTDSAKYKDSWGLFHLLMNLVGLESAEIIPASHWTIGKDFGGKLSREDFMSGFITATQEEMSRWQDLTVWTHRLIVAN